MNNKLSIHPKYIAEMLGTFVLALFVGISSLGSLPTPLIAGFALMLSVYALGHISGSHINPAVTLGLWSVNKISGKNASFYLAFQILGALLALLVLKGFFPDFTGALSHVKEIGTAKVLLAETIGAFFFIFGIATMVYRHESTKWNGFVIGGSLLIGVLIANVFGSLGILNPAVAILVLQNNIHFIYIIAPIIGGVCAMQLYRYLMSKNHTI